MSSGCVLPLAVTSVRGIIIPRQLKAYGDFFLPQKMGDRSQLHGNSDLALVKHKRRIDAVYTRTQCVEDFAMMGLDSSVVATLASHPDFGITVPSPVQQSAIPQILRRPEMLCFAAPSGSGKTLAYLAPLLSMLREDKVAHQIPVREQRPRAIVLAPTKELCLQIALTARRLATPLGLTVKYAVSRKHANQTYKRLSKVRKGKPAMDILVAHPATITKLLGSKRLFLDDIRHLVVDEADCLLSIAQHGSHCKALLRHIHHRRVYRHLWPAKPTIIMATACINRRVYGMMRQRYPSVPIIAAPGTHSPPSTVRHVFHKVRPGGEKYDALKVVLFQAGNWPRSRIGYNARGSQATYVSPRASLPWRTSGDAAGASSLAVPPLSSLAGGGGDWTDDDGDAKRATTAAVAARETNDRSAMTTHSKEIVMHPDVTGRRDGTMATSRSDEREGEDDADEGGSLDRSRLNVPPPTTVSWEHLTTIPAPYLTPFRLRPEYHEYVTPTARAHHRRVGGARVMVFFDKIDRCVAIYHKLRLDGYRVALLHGRLPTKVRAEHYRAFCSGDANILCATDLASRGLDLPVDRVVNFDAPRDALTYINRCGRTGRMGRRGTVVTLGTKFEAVAVDSLKLFVANERPLEGVTNEGTVMKRPTYRQFVHDRMNHVARQYVSLITRKTIPKHLERTYIRHNATWRPVFRPWGVHRHGGVPETQQKNIRTRVEEVALQLRKGKLADRKGGRAKFGSRRSGVWLNKGPFA